MADPGGNNSRLPAGALFSTAFPNVGVAAGALDSSGLDMVPLNVDASGNLKVAGSFTASLGGTSAVNITQVGGSTITLGQKGMATSFPVVIASDQSNVTTVLGTALPAGTNAIGTVSITQALPAGTNAIGTVSITQALPAGTNALGTVSITQALPAGANAIGTVSALQVGTWTVNFAGAGTSLRGATTASSTAAVVIIAAQNATTKIYVTGLQFGNSSGSTVVVQLNDSAASFFIVPSGGGNNPGSFLVPLALSTANASLTFSVLSTAVATVYVNAQGFGAA